ncbi:hypothetical protein [Verrucomicrobium spinosum]|uniref:hypothetical protein n=1 Tax=Verrucomicrobium spinosum TaxID=2736 RepID=UPI0009465098|nr:hypothetical protein [Verrucomicrobium spinosum]
MLQWITPSETGYGPIGYSSSEFTTSTELNSTTYFRGIARTATGTPKETERCTDSQDFTKSFEFSESRTYYQDQSQTSREMSSSFASTYYGSAAFTYLLTVSSNFMISDDVTRSSTMTDEEGETKTGSYSSKEIVSDDGEGGRTTWRTTEYSYETQSMDLHSWGETGTRRRLDTSSLTYSTTDGHSYNYETTLTNATSTTQMLTATYSVDVCTMETTAVTTDFTTLTSWRTYAGTGTVVTGADASTYSMGTTTCLIHVDWTTSTYEDLGEMFTETIQMTYQTITQVGSVVEGGTFACGDLDVYDTHYAPQLCHKLYTAGPHGGGLSAFDEVWSTVAETVFSAYIGEPYTDSFAHGTVSTYDSQTTARSVTGTYQTRVVTTVRQFRSESSMEFAEFNYSGTELTGTDAPVLLWGGGYNTWEINLRRLENGYMPASALATSDNIYHTYTIQVAASVTNVDEQALRAEGTTYPWLNVTQVNTIHSDDTLNMGGAVSPKTFAGVI